MAAPPAERRRRRRRPLSCALAAVLCLLASGAAVEAGLRLLAPAPAAAGGDYLWPPDQEWSFDPAPGVLPGVEGRVRVISNHEGLRADPLEPDQTYRILALGGSTTACIYLDQDETWTSLLQAHLDGVAGQRVWVGNGGKDGLSTRDHILEMEAIPPRVPDLDCVIVLAGVNDLLLRLSKDVQYDGHFMDRPDAEAILGPHVFSVRDAADERPPWERLRLVGAVERLLGLGPEHFVGRLDDPQGEVHEARRAVRRAARRFLDELPDLGPGLDEYARNLRTLIARGRERGLRMVLVTQPFLWRPDLPPELDRLVWMAGKGDFLNTIVHEYYTVEAMARGMAAYNHVTRSVAEETGVELVDLAPRLPKDTTVFYDDVHFNESGARKVADVLAGAFLAAPPFAP